MASSSREPLSPRPSPVAHNACLTCKKKKVRCHGGLPCTYCQRRSLDCRYPDSGDRRLYSVSKIRELKEKLALYERRSPRFVQEEGSDLTVSYVGQQSPEGDNSQVSGSMPNASLPTAQDKRMNEEGSVDRNTSESLAISADLSLSSNHRFGMEVQTVLSQGRSLPSSSHSPSSTLPLHDLQIPSACNRSDTLPDNPESLLPGKEDALRYFDAVVFYVGHSQHHFDLRNFHNRLISYYSAPFGTETDSMWYVLLLLVLAFGKLLLGEPGAGDGKYPGFLLYRLALSRLPNITVLYASGIPAVEVLSFFAIYLQNIDCRGEAYFYVSGALRLAISLRLHQDIEPPHMVHSELSHRCRLWWTVYMSERRLAAAMGYPPGIPDCAITVPLPKDSYGFLPAAPILINIRIAQITSEILTEIYTPNSVAKKVFVPTVSNIVRSLYDVAQQIPPDLVVDFSQPSDQMRTSRDALRTSISLHLMLYQAVILTLKPILLHLAKCILQAAPRSTDTIPSSLKMLSSTCIEAAKKSLRVLSISREQNMLSAFGFFNLEATFSTAFIMLLSDIVSPVIHGTHRALCGEGVAEALDLLHYLAVRGNSAAANQEAEILRVREHLSVLLPNISAQMVGPHERLNLDTGDPMVPEAQIQTPNLRKSSRPQTSFPLVDPSLESIDGLSQDTMSLFENLEGWTHEFIAGNDFGSWSYNNDTGLVENSLPDLEELERHVLSLGS